MLTVSAPSWWSGGRSCQRSSGSVGPNHPGCDDLVGELADRLVAQAGVAVLGDHRDDREDPAREVGPAGGGVVVGRVVQRLDTGRHALAVGQVVAVELL